MRASLTRDSDGRTLPVKGNQNGFFRKDDTLSLECAATTRVRILIRDGFQEISLAVEQLHLRWSPAFQADSRLCRIVALDFTASPRRKGKDFFSLRLLAAI